jgi:hypothetical protein
MYLHGNAKLGPAGRFALVQAVEEGCSIRAAALRFSVSPATAHRWWRRWRDASKETRRTLSCLAEEPHFEPSGMMNTSISSPPTDRHRTRRHYACTRGPLVVDYFVSRLEDSRPGLIVSLSISRPRSFLIRNSPPPWFLTIWRARSIASAFVFVCALTCL